MRKNQHLNTSQLGMDEDLDDISLEKLWEEAYAEDNFEKEILTLLRDGIKHSRKIPLGDCTEVDGKLFFRNRQYVSEHALLQTRFIRECHDRITSGHPKGANTYTLFSQNYWWPRAYADIKRYIRNCHTCSRNKPLREKYQGWLKLILPPSRRWKEVLLDYVGLFPASTFIGITYLYILVFTDRLTKMYHYELTVSMEAREAADIFYQTVFRLYGLSEAIVSD